MYIAFRLQAHPGADPAELVGTDIWDKQDDLDHLVIGKITGAAPDPDFPGYLAVTAEITEEGIPTFVQNASVNFVQ